MSECFDDKVESQSPCNAQGEDSQSAYILELRNATGRLRLARCLHALPGPADALSWSIDDEQVTESAIDAAKAWHKRHPGDVSVRVANGNMFDNFRATPVRWMVLVGIILMLVADGLLSLGIFRDSEWVDTLDKGYVFGALLIVLIFMLCVVGVVRTCEIVPTTSDSTARIRIQYVMPKCLVGRFESDIEAANRSYDEIKQGFVFGCIWAEMGFVCLPKQRIDPDDVRGVFIRTIPSAVVGIAKAVLFMGFWAAGVSALVWLNSAIPDSGFAAGLLRSIGDKIPLFAFSFFLLFVIPFGLWWIVRGGWAFTTCQVRLRMRRGRSIYVGSCDAMDISIAMDAVAGLLSSLRTGESS